MRTHISYLPTAKQQNEQLTFIPERDPRILDDLVVACAQVAFGTDFQLGLGQRFFPAGTDNRIRPKKVVADEVSIQGSLFAKDEASAIDWLRQLLKNQPTIHATTCRLKQK